MPPSHAFWQQYFPPNGWNCRCNVVQVLREKYPTTPDSEVEHLIRRNDSDNPKEQFFRFNPGQERKTFPDYNPYTIKRCRDCDIAKGKAKLAKFVPENEVCQACQILRANQIEINRAEYERLEKDPNWKDVEFDEKTGGVKATHIGHGEDGDKDRKYFGNLTGADLEKECQNWLFKWGHRALLRDEYVNLHIGERPPALDLDLNGKIMDIKSITSAEKYGNSLSAKNRQIGRVKRNTGVSSDAVCLYFHDPSMFSEERLLKDIEWYKNKIIEWGSTQRIKHIYVVLPGAEDYVQYDI